jgi:hypothetical protein
MKLKLHSALFLLISIVIFSCSNKKDNYLTKQERTIVGGLYFGMPKDSLESLVGNQLSKGYFSVNKCWAELREPTVYYYVSSFDYSEFKIPNSTSHLGIVVPGFRNNRLASCNVFPVWAVEHDLSNSIFQQANLGLLMSIPGLLKATYGEDSLYFDEAATTTAIEAAGYKEYSIASMVHTYKTKFGKVEFIEGLHDIYTEWRDRDKSYICWSSAIDSTTGPSSIVKEYPLIRYELDPKYDEQLGLNKSGL